MAARYGRHYRCPEGIDRSLSVDSSCARRRSRMNAHKYIAVADLHRSNMRSELPGAFTARVIPRRARGSVSPMKLILVAGLR